MAQIRDSSIIRTPEVTIDPRFALPGDVIDLKQHHRNNEHLESHDNDSSDELIEVTLDQTVPSSDALDEPETTATIHAPQFLTVISQTVRIAPDGTSFVDVILETEDVLGAETYEIRTTK